jgi:hypothetical protein
MKKIIICQVSVIALSCLFGTIWYEKEALLTLLALLFVLYSLSINRKNRRFSFSWTILPVLAYLLCLSFYKFEYGIQKHGLWLFAAVYIPAMLIGYGTGFFLSKCRETTVHISILTVLALILVLLSIFIGNYPFGFMMAGIIYVAAPYLAYRYISQKLHVSMAVITPWIIFNMEPWSSGSVASLPLTLIPFCSAGIFYLAFLLKQKRMLQMALLTVYTLFLSYMWYCGYEGYMQWIKQ